MTTHAISEQSRTWWGWPSIQHASDMLAVRIATAEAWGMRLAVTKAGLVTWVRAA